MSSNTACRLITITFLGDAKTVPLIENILNFYHIFHKFLGALKVSHIPYS